jgi:xanthine/uracil permease
MKRLIDNILWKLAQLWMVLMLLDIIVKELYNSNGKTNMTWYRNPYAYTAYATVIAIVIASIIHHYYLNVWWNLLLTPFVGYIVWFFGKSMYYSWIKNPIDAWKQGDRSQGYSAIAALGVMAFVTLIIILFRYV